MVVEVYRDSAHRWRWRAISPNDGIVAMSKFYTRRRSAKRSARLWYPGVKIRRG